ncbi:MAG: LacI family DNA-binding transcriptional regulator [Thermodesulfobacteriota bacterium]
MSRVTIKDIARKLNVSATTVSNALNGKPGVGKSARKEIQDLARAMGYQPNYFAKGLVSRQSYAIGLVITNITDPFYPELALGVQEKAGESGYSTMLFNTNHNQESQETIIRMLGAKGVDGVILSTVRQDDPAIDLLDEMEMPYVLVNRMILNPRKAGHIDSVTLDNYSGSHQAATHLCRLGHTRIAVIAGDMDASTAITRTGGAMDAFKEWGVFIPDNWFVDCGYTKDRAFTAAQKILTCSAPRPTAILAQDDNMALGVREAAYAAGLRIPEDLALVGFNDISFASLIGIELTTIRQDQHHMGMTCAEILIKKLQDPKRRGLCNNVLIQTELVIRKSCGFYPDGYT